MPTPPSLFLAFILSLPGFALAAGGHDHQGGTASKPASADDPRALVQLPAPMQAHLLANMRDHLRALDEILKALAADDPELAAEVAEQRLGMSSLDDHGAAHLAGFMPAGMQAAGTAMHRAASRFAREAQTGLAADPWGALSQVTEACVACHAAYRIR